MLAGIDDIESVTFQEVGLEGVDDVVVRRSHGLPMVCVQVKHKKASTATTNNLTFGSLVTEEGSGEGRGPINPCLPLLLLDGSRFRVKKR